ncbi:MAG: hypothetical protein M3Y82_06305 [Verrucomicrobiota bacterium]|nr:hypothetical protein [Verrucomicrobiota bacterium]
MTAWPQTIPVTEFKPRTTAALPDAIALPTGRMEVPTASILTGNYARIEGNHMVDNNGRNLKLDIGSGTLVIRNTVNGGGATSFNVPPGNLVGPLLGTAAAIATNSNPHANFAF